MGEKPALRRSVSREGSKLDYWTRREWGGLAQGAHTAERKSRGVGGGEEWTIQGGSEFEMTVQFKVCLGSQGPFPWDQP